MMAVNKIHCIDALKGLKKLDDESIECVMTSPPYWQIRDFHADGQIGLEKHWSEHLKRLWSVFDEVRRVLRADGTCWINLGDKYDQKSLLCLPERFAIGMLERGWKLRNRIIWKKPNCLPSAVRDRFTVDYESIFLFTKSKKYYFNGESVREPSSTKTRLPKQPSRGLKTALNRLERGVSGGGWADAKIPYRPQRRWRRCVWSIPIRRFSEAHFAVFPEELVKIMMLAGCPCGGVVLDPFMGSGTVAVMAKRLGCHYLGFEINREYVEMARRRIKSTPANTLKGGVASQIR